MHCLTQIGWIIWYVFWANCTNVKQDFGVLQIEVRSWLTELSSSLSLWSGLLKLSALPSTEWKSNLLSFGNEGSRLAGFESLLSWVSVGNGFGGMMWSGPMFWSGIAIFCGIKICWIITKAGAVTWKTACVGAGTWTGSSFEHRIVLQVSPKLVEVLTLQFCPLSPLWVFPLFVAVAKGHNPCLLWWLGHQPTHLRDSSPPPPPLQTEVTILNEVASQMSVEI